MTGSKKILIVEDDVDIASIYSLMLKKNGYDVQTVSNGIEALELILSFQPQILLLDIMIPGIDGLAVLKTVRNDPKYSQIQPLVLITTNLAQQDTREQAKAYGAQGYVVKANIVPSDLVDIIKELPARAGEL